MITLSILTVLALFAFGSGVRGLILNNRRNKARRAEQKEWNAFFARLEEEESAKAAIDNRNFPWEG